MLGFGEAFYFFFFKEREREREDEEGRKMCLGALITSISSRL